MLKSNYEMIIKDFPKTLGGVSFDKADKLFGGRKTELFRCVVFPSPKPPTFPGNDQRGFPVGNPKLMFFLLLLLLNNVDRKKMRLFTSRRKKNKRKDENS